MGPGVFRKDGKILGVSISDGTFKEYYNLGHYDCSADERAHNLVYLREVLGNNAIKVGHRLMYDMDWLENGEYAIKINGPLRSTDIAEALIDENQGEYSLEFIAQKYLKQGKAVSLPERFCQENGLKGDFRTWLWKMPHALVRAYAMDDADLPLKIDAIQTKTITAEDMVDLYKLECELIRCLLFFRLTGVLIDQDLRDKHALWTQNFLEEHRQKITETIGKPCGKKPEQFNYNSSMQVAGIFDKFGVPYAKTGLGNPQITRDSIKPWIGKYPIVKLINEAKRAEKMIDTFLLGSLKRFVTEDNRIHCQFYNTRVDEYGTRSGRFSSAHPNLQQIPSKERKNSGERIEELCREIFIPLPGCWWGKVDYSQIEYRFMAHFASGPGSEELREAYRNNPGIDYHKYIETLTGLGRGLAKNLNFGIAYGMGAKHMAEVFGWEISYCREILDIYHTRAPYARATMQAVMQVAQRRGYIRTFLHRRSRLLDKSKAYIMYCRLMQGSAADLMKAGMLKCYQDGIFNILPPHLTVHDELNVSVPKTKAGINAFKEMQHTMETCLTLKVPIMAKPEIGPAWGLVEKFEWSDLYKEVSK